MYWCKHCDCAYPHGTEGPSEALRKHIRDHHAPPPETGPPVITGWHIVIGLFVLAALAWIGRHIGR
ncbi:hypothetical protein ACIP5N_31985 [Streptomyces sp. NPDC088768]|uniref:hypothetical protein n=1 Tax=Streptomyces sp. NPDC088768 TaxID=3365894 RepID=UPI00380F6FD8